MARTRQKSSRASTQPAVIVGQRMAARVRRARTAALRRRAAVIERAPASARARAMPIQSRFIRAAGPRGIATLVAEGDSWFDYLWFDVLNQLEDEHGFDVESVAGAGDRVEDMAYSGGQLARLRKLLEKLLRRGDLPRAILLSGGGNDVAGQEFAMLLDHASSATAGLNPDIVRGVIDVRVRNAYVAILTAVTDTCVTTTGHEIPILLHGYDRPVPDGRGVAGGFWLLPGPWLRPGFHAKGFLDPKRNKAIVGELIDRFNEMLQRLVADPRFEHVAYVDLRGTLPTGANYTDWWGNELHPTNEGFKAVARKFAKAIATL